MNESDFSTLLGIPDVIIENVKLNNKDEVFVYLRSTKTGTNCHCCGKYTEDYYCLDAEQQVRHLSAFGKPCYIVIKQPRYRCSCCSTKPLTTQSQSWRVKGSKNTIAFERHILLSLVNSTIEDISIKESIGYSAIEGILERYIKAEVDWTKIDSLKLMGIDEISLRKGRNQFVTIVTSRDEITEETHILAILEGRKKETVKKFCQHSQ